jgi:hypothetical protein
MAAEKIGVQALNKPRRRVQKNYALRNELIAKGHIIPVQQLPKHLRAKGFLAAAEEAARRLAFGLPLFVR